MKLTKDQLLAAADAAENWHLHGPWMCASNWQNEDGYG